MLLAEFDAENHERTIREEGWLGSKIEDVLKLLERFGQVPKQIVELIREEDNPNVLNRWFDSAVRAGSIEEFEENM